MARQSVTPVFDDDPWGFGAPDGVLVEVRPDPWPRTGGDPEPRPAMAGLPLPPADNWPAFGEQATLPAPRTRRQPRTVALSTALLMTLVTAGLSVVGVQWLASGARTRWAWLPRPTAPSVTTLAPPVTTPAPAVVPVPSPPALPPPSAEAARAPGAAATTPPSSTASTPGATTAPAPAGAVVFDAPFDLDVYLGGRFLGAAESVPLRVPSGRHTFALVNARLGFRVAETLDVGAGVTTRHVVAQRTVPVRIDVQPPAEVIIDGRSYGAAVPLDLELPLGTRIVTVRHPDLGERIVPMTVAIGAANRLDVDLER